MKLLRAALISLSALMPVAAMAQSTVLQGGAWTPGHLTAYSSYGGQPIVIDGGGAGGGAIGQNLSELGIVSRSPTNTYPSANSGNGPNGEHGCLYDAPITNATGYHYLCLDPNAQGGGLISYGSGGTASQNGLSLKVNGVVYNIGQTGSLFPAGPSVLGGVYAQTGYSGLMGLGSAANYGIGTSGATVPLNNGKNIESGQWQFGNLLVPITDPNVSAAVGNVITTYPGSTGALGPLYAQSILSFSGGAANIFAATNMSTFRAYQQIQSNVGYVIGIGLTGSVDNYSFLAQGVGAVPYCYSWHDGGCWGENPLFQEFPETYTATSGQTTFSVPNSFGQGQSTVLKNGVTLTLGSQYTEASCSGTPALCANVVLASAATAGDTIVVWRGDPQTPHIGSEIDGYIGPGNDNYFYATQGHRVIVTGAAKYVGPAGSSGQVGTIFDAFTSTGASAKKGYGFSGDGGVYNGVNGFDCSNTIFTQNCFYSQGILSQGQNIGIGSGSQFYAIEIAGNTTTMPAGAGIEFQETTGTTIDGRIFSDHASGTVALGSWSNNDVTIWRNSSVIARFYSSAFVPGVDTTMSLGSNSLRWLATYSETYFAGAGNSAGVSCSGTPSASFATVGGIVTHC